MSHSPLLTSFPYTTLFRSDPAFSREPRGRRPADVSGQPEPGARDSIGLPLDPRGRALFAPRAASQSNAPPLCRRADRKSTRLNSSHLVISYAVFCLKKKIK